MGGNKKHKKGAHSSSFSIFNFFKSKRGRSRKEEQHYDNVTSSDDVSSASKVWPSDGDKGRHWVAEPGIDRKAKDYIDRIHRNRVLETQRQTLTLHPHL